MEFDVQTFVGTVGVPAAICFYTMMTLRKAVDANTKAVTILATKLGVDLKEE